MVDPNTFSIIDGEGGFTLKVLEKTNITDTELVNILGDKHIVRIQELLLAKQREQYESLKPVGFNFAPESAKKKRKEAQSTDNVEQLQWMHDNVSYNSDGTMNIIKLNKTFCEDISGTGQRCNWKASKKLAKSKGYRLGSDYNDCDSKDIKEASDWYKVINIFSNGKGDTIQGMELFRDMAGCNDWYRTATEDKDDNLEGVARERLLLQYYCGRRGGHTYNAGRVCGFKDAM